MGINAPGSNIVGHNNPINNPSNGNTNSNSNSNPTANGNKTLLLPHGQAPPPNSEEGKIYALIAELLDPATRETALLELSKKREMYEDLALVLWGGFGKSLCGHAGVTVRIGVFRRCTV